MVILSIGLIAVSNLPELIHDVPGLWSVSDQIDRRFDRIRMAREEGVVEVVLTFIGFSTGNPHPFPLTYLFSSRPGLHAR